jgi:HEPN domain-containing protein
MPSIYQSLTDSAKRYAILTANEFVSGEFAACALAAGIAVEHALKATIAAESPVYLAFGRNDDAWFRSARKLLSHASDSVTFDSVSGEVKTIGGSQAFERASIIDPNINR